MTSYLIRTVWIYKTWNEDFYYVMGYSEYYGKVVTHRVDRIRDAQVLQERAKGKPKGFKLKDYAQKIFEMYDGDEAKVKLECKARLMKYVIDRFGDGVKTGKIDDDRFLATVDVALSPTFYVWVFQFKDGIKIKSPKKAVDEMQAMAEAIIGKEEKNVPRV